jgi:hypothetical protein
MKKLILSWALVVFLLVLEGCAAAQTVTVTDTATNTVQVTVTKTITVTATATLTPTSTPATFTGAGDITTEPFQINSQDWKVSWTYTTSASQYASFSIFVYQIGNSVPIAMLDNESSSGSSFSYSGPGQYYFETNTANLDSWTITAQDAP